MSDSIYRYVIDVDDLVHTFDLSGDPLHVAAVDINRVEFWAAHDGDGSFAVRNFTVVGTGQPIRADKWRHFGSVVVPAIPGRTTGRLVWHLIEITKAAS